MPLRWERADAAPEAVDERLWFEASCGGQDFLVGNPHTFVGRIAAWCPHHGAGYSVSLSELTVMSTESQYFVKGFMVGNEPAPPMDGEGNSTPEDDMAWRAATSRFRRTGDWYGRWGTCETCGCVLLPDTASERCAEHLVTLPTDE